MAFLLPNGAPPLPLEFRFPGCPPRLRLVGSPDVTDLSYAKRNSIHVLRFVDDQMNRLAGVAAPEPCLFNRTSVELLAVIACCLRDGRESGAPQARGNRESSLCSGSVGFAGAKALLPKWWASF